MNRLTIYSKSGSEVATVALKTNSEQSCKLLGEDIVKVFFELKVSINFNIGDYITLWGKVYTLNTFPVVRKISSRLFDYEAVFESKLYELSKVVFLDLDASGVHMSHEFFVTGNVELFSSLIESNLQRVYNLSWFVTLIGLDLEEVKTLSFSENNCHQALIQICQEFGCEYEIKVNAGRDELVLKEMAGGYAGYNFEYGKGNGLYEIKRSLSTSNNLTTRLYAFGASKNLGANYRGYSPRLRLPELETEGKDYIEKIDTVASFGLFERVVIFDEIFPSREGSVTGLGGSVYEFIDAGMFDLNELDSNGDSKYIIRDLDAKISFLTGNLAGYEFVIANYETPTKKITINKYVDERGTAFPSENEPAFQIQPGDKYVILDIVMPESYIEDAENRLSAKATEWLNKYSNEQVTYELTIDPIFARENEMSFGPGDAVGVTDTDLGVNEQIRITEVVRNLVNEYEFRLKLSDSTFIPKKKGISRKELKSRFDNQLKLSSLQADWNEQNPNEPTFIKNKPDLSLIADKNLVLPVNYKLFEVIAHNLGKEPAVSVLGEDNIESIADIEHIDINTVKVTFSDYFTGKIVFN